MEGGGGSKTWPRCPPPTTPCHALPHLLPVAEAEPDGLHALVVGDDSLQGGHLPGLLHPGQVGTRVFALALPLWGEPSVPGHPWEMGGA